MLLEHAEGVVLVLCFLNHFGVIIRHNRVCCDQNVSPRLTLRSLKLPDLVVELVFGGFDDVLNAVGEVGLRKVFSEA